MLVVDIKPKQRGIFHLEEVRTSFRQNFFFFHNEKKTEAVSDHTTNVVTMFPNYAKGEKKNLCPNMKKETMKPMWQETKTF